jgi:hypothetical protein
MFLIIRGNRPIAKLDRVEDKWEMNYLPGNFAINPVLPVGETHKFKALPRFLLSLLPSEARAIMAAKSRHIDPSDIAALARQCLATENVGDLRLVTNISMIADPEVRLKGGLTVEAATPNALFAESVESLRHPNVSARINETLKTLASASGIGGAFPKAFLYTDGGGYILKKYPQANEISGEQLASMEEASLKAMKSLGAPAASATAIGDMLVVERFDKHFDRAAGVCHIADLDPEQDNAYAGSHEGMAKLIVKHAGQQVAQAFVKQALFSWALRDSDHHRENYAMIRREALSAWEMAPLYDSMPTSLIDGDKEELALTVNAKKAKMSLKDWAPLAKIAGMEMKVVSEWLTSSVKAIEEHVVPVAGSLAPDLKEHLAVVALVAQDKTYQDAQREVLTKSVSLGQVPIPLPEQTLPSVGGDGR